MNEIQSILFPEERFKQDLYFLMFHKNEVMYDGIEVVDGSIILNKKDHISTNSYFNSFYESYWVKYSSIRSFFLKVRFRGSLSIKMYRDEPGAGARLIKVEKRHHEYDEELIVKIPSNFTSLVKGYAGRIFFDFKAHAASEISEISICTEQPAKRDIKLSLGICTFSREAYLADTIESISGSKDLAGIVSDIFIVNQGPCFSDLALIENIKGDPRIKLIEQDNLGGCGGFTRTLIEAKSQAGQANYHLLMDDDIVIDPRVIRNCASFIEYSNDELVLGGSMLDSLRPHILYEAGARLKNSNVIQSIMHNLDISDPESLSALSSPVHVDFNAWWFCAIPLSALGSIRYPAPIFIRGDDFEFGIRLAKSGYETVSLPGIAVWHEPFYAKPPGWQQYYDLRNRLIFAACHDDLVNIQSPNHLLRHAFVEPLLTHNYQALNLNLKAIEDFLSGPDALFSMPSDQKHAEVMTLFAGEKTQVVSRQKAEGFGYMACEPRGDKKRGVKLTYVAQVLKRLLLKPIEHPKGILLDVDVRSTSVGNSGYIMTNGPRSYFLLFSPDRQKFGHYLRRLLKTHSRYKAERRRAASLWKNNISQWRGDETWRHMFGKGLAVSEQAECFEVKNDWPAAVRQVSN